MAQCFPGCLCDNCKRDAEFDAEMARLGYTVERHATQVWRETMSAKELTALAFSNWLSDKAAKIEGSDADHPVATQREKVAERVRDVIEDLKTPGAVKREQAIDLKNAAERCIANEGLRGAIGRL